MNSLYIPPIIRKKIPSIKSKNTVCSLNACVWDVKSDHDPLDFFGFCQKGCTICQNKFWVNDRFLEMTFLVDMH